MLISHEHEKVNLNLMKEFSIVNTVDIMKIIKRSSKKSCDLDPIPTYMLVKCLSGTGIVDVLTCIINQSLSSGKCPDSFKHALVIPLLKKQGLEHIYKNYRHVSNLSYISKLLERVVSEQLLAHIYENGLDVVYQSAYKMYHSTESALLRV